jgi:hypothetical protein
MTEALRARARKRAARGADHQDFRWNSNPAERIFVSGALRARSLKSAAR